MDLCTGETIGVSVMLVIALFVATRILIEELREEIADRKRRNHWKHYKRYR